ncbi:MAG: hypothetical protein EO766_12345 [Hydrotalea sp. AMD]|uniref:hypothetical protein n=1 Tax=Hydrotalea sp. AMD TaxID=2501297 RepID=UPI001024A3CE|nr:hypothetical protein [Hydrotalea sp. AMD]RWZ87308.1 MAG: hypothetical protein EO766_12345 [Hydrotalea sp. AMD]
MESTVNFVNINSQIVKLNDIVKIDLSKFKSETIDVYLIDNQVIEVTGFPALELIWLIKPSVLEGKTNIRFKKNSWVIHNLIAHPLMQILAWFKMYKQAIWIHDITVPKPIRFK